MLRRRRVDRASRMEIRESPASAGLLFKPVHPKESQFMFIRDKAEI
jgi:hypothetical protein